MIDTHTHLYLPEFQDDGGGAAAVRRALDVDVEHLVFPNVDRATIEPMKALAALFPTNISMAMGIHPTEVKDNWREELAYHIQELAQAPYIAVGEVGIDLYWDRTFREHQMQAFEIQVEEAIKRNLPLIIHCREGLDETLEVLCGHPQARAVFHSFGGTIQDVERIRKVNDYYFGINGIVTFKNCKLRDVLPAIGLDRILLETDSPYLAPVPRRGKRNESSFLPYIASHIADHLSLTLSQVKSCTTKNALTLFPQIFR